MSRISIYHSIGDKHHDVIWWDDDYDDIWWDDDDDEVSHYKDHNIERPSIPRATGQRIDHFSEQTKQKITEVASIIVQRYMIFAVVLLLPSQQQSGQIKHIMKNQGCRRWIFHHKNHENLKFSQSKQTLKFYYSFDNEKWFFASKSV